MAGLVSGIVLAVGLECAPYIAVCGAALALRHVFDRDAGVSLRRYGLALAGSTIVAFLLAVPPIHWLQSQCDTIAINSAAAVVCAGLTLALVGVAMLPTLPVRAFAITGAACVSLTVPLLFEPRCIHGPFALVDPAIWPVWHDQVRELQPLFRLFGVNPLTAAAIAAYPAAALVATLALARERDLRRDFGFLAAAAVFLAATATTVMAIRGFSYAIWFGMPLVAAAALRLFAALRIERLVTRIAVAVLLTPLVISSGAITLAFANGLEDKDGFGRPAMRPCFATASYALLARLSEGLVVADVSFGPFLLALTPHSAMAAPYHRLGPGIVASHRALASPPEEAHGILKQYKADYVMVCGPRPPDGLTEPARHRSLWGMLQAGRAPDWLERIPDTGPFAVYRVRG